MRSDAGTQCVYSFPTPFLVRRWFGTLALAISLLLTVDTLWAQLPQIESIDVLPTNPTVADPVTLSISGSRDMFGARILRSDWQIENTDISIDLLAVRSLVGGGPAILIPFTDQTEIGILPAGSYDVTARVFLVLWVNPADGDPFTDPWDFPDMFMDEEPFGTMTTQFAVVPEPPSIIIILTVVVLLGIRRTWRMFRLFFIHPVTFPKHTYLLPALRYSRGWVGTLALAFSLLLTVDTLWAQLPRIESIDVLPTNPTVAEAVTLSVSGSIDWVGQDIIRSPWQIENTDVSIDLLVVNGTVGGPPAIPIPFTDQSEIGFLPAGSYDVTARVFRVFADPLSDPFTDPWDFPEMFMDEEPFGTMTTQFAVVPEPPSIIIILTVVVLLGIRRTWRMFRLIFIHSVTFPKRTYLPPALRCSRGWVGTLALAFSLLLAVDALGAGNPRIKNIDVLPPNPTVADPLTLSLSGTINDYGQQIVRSAWQIENTDLSIDLLVVHGWIAGPPSLDVPFTDQTEIGFLPAGSYDVTTRVFRAIGLPRLDGVPFSDPFTDPWEFPDMFMGEEPSNTMTAQFTVVPEPPGIVIILAVVVLLGIRRTWRMFRTPPNTGQRQGGLT